jgi:lipopolysaccharide/colanic/teichoic acid biosynthesis glycosyltransferase
MKRIVDGALSLIGLALASPVLLPVLFLIWAQDRHSPFYIAPRVGLGEKVFRMVKLRSMRVGADKTGVDSTAANDRRITPIGAFVRRYKLDELMQLWNVLRGDMSLVGPRPNVERETRMYTAEEKRLLQVRPGVTDFASIVFADEGEILEGHADADIAYNQLIRPWKSRLGLFYVDHRTIWLDVQLIALTALALVSRASALRAVAGLLASLGAPEQLSRVALRELPLQPAPPPGAESIVTERA